MSGPVPGPGSPRPRGELFNRIGYYVLGVALGCVLLGLISMNRQAKRARMQQPPAQQQPVSPAR